MFELTRLRQRRVVLRDVFVHRKCENGSCNDVDTTTLLRIATTPHVEDATARECVQLGEDIVKSNRTCS
jgi:CO dehydrogenase/acetyl-CoA synthase delta subunit